MLWNGFLENDGECCNKMKDEGLNNLYIKIKMLQALNPIFDFFLPRICPACETKLNYDESYVCNNCMSKIKLADEDRLKKTNLQENLKVKI